MDQLSLGLVARFQESDLFSRIRDPSRSRGPKIICDMVADNRITTRISGLARKAHAWYQAEDQ